MKKTKKESVKKYKEWMQKTNLIYRVANIFSTAERPNQLYCGYIDVNELKNYENTDFVLDVYRLMDDLYRLRSRNGKFHVQVDKDYRYIDFWRDK